MRWWTDLYGQRLPRPHPDERFSRDIRRMRFMHHHAKRIDWEADVTQAAETPAVYVYTLALLLFPVCDNKYHGTHTSAGVPRLVTHRDDDDTVSRDSSRDSGFSSRPRKTKPRRWWCEHRNRTHDYTAVRLRLSAAKILWRMDAERVFSSRLRTKGIGC